MSVQESEQASVVVDAPVINADGGPVPLPELDTEESFSKAVDELLRAMPIREGDILTGKVVEIGKDEVAIALGDVVGRIDANEFYAADGTFKAAVGAEVSVFVEGHDGEALRLSHEKAETLREWDRIDEMLSKSEIVEGVITGLCKGGLNVDIGIKAFLPSSQVDVRPQRNLERYVGQRLQFKISRADRRRRNVVLSRRELLETEQAGLKAAVMDTLRVGATVQGTVKNLTEYGCFVDLGGVDGLLHVTDMSWGRIAHPRDVVTAGQELSVQVLQIDAEGGRIKLGLKQLTKDPWLEVDRRYRKGQRVAGRVVNLADFGAFVELDGGMEGLIHVSQLSWTQRIRHPSEVLKKGDEVEAIILGIDTAARRISLGYKQTQENPWNLLQDTHPVGSRVRGPVRSVTNFGVFIGVSEGIDGLVHVSDLSWNGQIKDPREAYKAGDEVEAVVLNIDAEAERLSLGIKQLDKDPWHDIEHRYAIGQLVEGRVVRILDFGAIVQLEENVEALIHISELSDERVESVGAVLKEGETVQAKVVSVIADQRKMGLSIKRVQEAAPAVAAPSAAAASAPAPKRLTIGDLIKEKIGDAALPPGKPKG